MDRKPLFAGHGRSSLTLNGIETVFHPSQDAETLLFVACGVTLGMIARSQFPEGCHRVLIAKDGGSGHFGTWRLLADAKFAAAAILSGADFPSPLEQTGLEDQPAEGGPAGL